VTKRVFDKDPYSEELLDIERVTSSSGMAVRGVIPSPTITVDYHPFEMLTTPKRETIEISNQRLSQ
jgi:hypothetical protein